MAASSCCRANSQQRDLVERHSSSLNAALPGNGPSRSDAGSQNRTVHSEGSGFVQILTGPGDKSETSDTRPRQETSETPRPKPSCREICPTWPGCGGLTSPDTEFGVPRTGGRAATLLIRRRHVDVWAYYPGMSKPDKRGPIAAPRRGPGQRSVGERHRLKAPKAPTPRRAAACTSGKKPAAPAVAVVDERLFRWSAKCAARNTAPRRPESRPHAVNRGSAAYPQRDAGSPPAGARKRPPDLDVVVAVGRIPQDVVFLPLDLPTARSVDSARSPGSGAVPDDRGETAEGRPGHSRRKRPSGGRRQHPRSSSTGRVRDVFSPTELDLASPRPRPRRSTETDTEPATDPEP